MKKSEIAKEKFETLNCNQAVLVTWGPGFGLSEELCIKTGLSFGGGMGRLGKTCGAVTGAFMVIGLWASEQSDDLQEQKKLAAKKVLEFNILFSNKFKTLECVELLGLDISDPEEYIEISRKNLFNTLCPVFVGYASDILEEILT
jgi:C_GCAxxG_C_C family probable redox protein